MDSTEKKEYSLEERLAYWQEKALYYDGLLMFIERCFERIPESDRKAYLSYMAEIRGFIYKQQKYVNGRIKILSKSIGGEKYDTLSEIF
ncbi:MAG: hypothetical protein H9W81_15070 [Enterococcus sp.]|nr:hypothetical protein [Enterococcus sp.]